MVKFKRQLQQMLKDIGLLDTVDGIVGNDTVQAVKKLIDSRDLKDPEIDHDVDPDPDKISKNFTMSELLRSDTANRRGFSNQPSKQHRENLIESTKNLWQPVRDILNSPMIITSGYRSSELNRAVGGSNTSAHSLGYAIDFRAPGFGNTRKIADVLSRELKARGIKFDQIILEFPDSPNSWIHLGYKRRDQAQRNQLLTAVKRNGRTVYLKGLH